MFVSSKLSNNDSPAVQGFSQDVHGALTLQYKTPTVMLFVLEHF